MGITAVNETDVGLARAFHRAVGMVDGSLTKNLNEIAVRLWT